METGLIDLSAFREVNGLTSEKLTGCKLREGKRSLLPVTLENMQGPTLEKLDVFNQYGKASLLQCLSKS
jgi:hypothetical protein